ncbi:MAG: UDP-N-acetylmuramate--L-alanine ligase [Oscillibacter sp.]|nr:UDP-N-acetylmuramate--L-alanine ligase [Oscillibacter sp.]
MEKDRIHDYILPGKRAHLVGIGGVSMSPRAEVLHGEGLIITGSDMKESSTVDRLRSLGIPVTIGHLPESVAGKDLVIRTAAVHNDNPEIAAALAAGIPVFERAEAWGSIMRRYENALCISGTHGKTTTTSMCTHIFLAAEKDPTVMIGGTLPALHAGYRVGKGDTIILESCEYRNSFLYFSPTVAVILNVEADHLDFFQDLADVQRSFRKFAELVPEAGRVVVNADNDSAMETVRGLDRPLITFGVKHPADCTAENLHTEDGFPVFDVKVRGETYAHVRLRVHGEHNVSNALAAASAAWVLGLPGSAVEEGLAAFTGAGRRFERKGTYHGADVYDDYAHHPDELHALLSMAKELNYARIIVAFQPHTYSRTAKLFDRFAEELRRADGAVLAEIYAAREQNDLGISSADLCKEIPGSVYCSTLEDTANCLRQMVRPGDLVLTVGAGDIYKVGEALVKDADHGGEQAAPEPMTAVCGGIRPASPE